MDQYHAQSSLKKVEELQRIARQEQAGPIFCTHLLID